MTPKLAVIIVLAWLLSGCTAPSPLDTEALNAEADTYKKVVANRAALLPDNITLPEALLFALEHNLEFRLQAYQTAMATGNRQLAHMSMLPSVTARAGYRQRSNVQASVSESVDTGQISLAASTSSDRSGHNRDLELGWNVLDFGLAWFRAREFGEQALIAEEERRRVSHQLALDVITAWDRVVMFQRLSEDLAQVHSALAAGLSLSERVDQSRLRDQADIIEYRKGLLLMLRRVHQLTRQMEDAHDELARLMGIAPADLPRLDVTPDTIGFFGATPSLPKDALHRIALSERPEMRQALYLARSAKNETRRRVLETLPALLFTFSTRYDSNSYLVNNHWRDSSMNLSFNLVRLASLSGQRRLGKLNEEAASARIELQAVAIMSQVSIADKAWRGAAQDACLVQTLSRLDNRRLDLMDARAKAALVDQLTITRLQIDNILFQIESGLAMADMRRAMFMLAMSLGVGVIPDIMEDQQESPSIQLTHWLTDGIRLRLNELILEAQDSSPGEDYFTTLPDWESTCELL
jgi:outer membrane protein TolC